MYKSMPRNFSAFLEAAFRTQSRHGKDSRVLLAVVSVRRIAICSFQGGSHTLLKSRYKFAFGSRQEIRYFLRDLFDLYKFSILAKFATKEKRVRSFLRRSLSSSAHKTRPRKKRRCATRRKLLIDAAACFVARNY